MPALRPVLLKLNKARIQMVKTGRFRDTPECLARELSDLRRKVPLGSELRMYFETIGTRPTSFDHFVSLVRRFQMAKQPPKGEAGRAAQEAESWPEEPIEGEEGWDEEAEYGEEEEPAHRLNDARMVS